MTIPINEKDSAILIKLNEHLKSSEFKTILGDGMNKFRLKNIILIDDEDKSYPNRITVNIKYDGDEKNKTRIYQGLNGNNEVTYNTIDEFQEIVKYGNTYVFVIKLSGIWVVKATIPEPAYGIRFQVDKVFIIN